MNKSTVVYGLIKTRDGVEDYRSVILRNQLLSLNLGTRVDYVMFVESQMPEEHRDAISSYIDAKIIEVDSFAFDWSKINHREDDSVPAGYNHMCDFYALRVWDKLRKYKLAWRMDDDSFLLSSATAALASLEKSTRLQYAYVCKKTETHARTNETLTRFMGVASPIENYYNNINICSTEIWTSEGESYLANVDASLGIYKYRWGDSSIQAVFLDNMKEKGKIDFTKLQLSYLHDSHKHWSNFWKSNLNSLYLLLKYYLLN